MRGFRLGTGSAAEIDHGALTAVVVPVFHSHLAEMRFGLAGGIVIGNLNKRHAAGAHVVEGESIDRENPMLHA